MRVLELYDLAKWFNTNITATKLPSILQNISNNLKGKQTNSAEVLKSGLEKLNDILKNIYVNNLTENQISCLNSLHLSWLLSEKDFKSLFNPANVDMNYVISTLDVYIKNLNDSAPKMTQLQNHINTIVPKKFLKYPDMGKGKVLTKLVFHQDASITNISELNNWSNSWYTIARGLSISIKEAPEDFKIVDAERGSFILYVVTGLGITKLIFEVLKSFTDLAISITKLKSELKSAEGLKSMVSEDIYKKFIAEAEEKISAQEEKVIDKVIEKLKQEDLIIEKRNTVDLKRSIKELYKFNSKGGELKCIASNDEQFNDEDIQLLNEKYKELQDKSELKFIEDHSDSDKAK